MNALRSQNKHRLATWECQLIRVLYRYTLHVLPILRQMFFDECKSCKYLLSISIVKHNRNI